MEALEKNLPPGDQALLWKPKQLDGISVFKAHFNKFSYKKHTHQEFAIGLIERGVQTFHHSGSRHIALRGTMITVNPDEVHDGISASKSGYEYRMVYVDPLKMHEMLASHYKSNYNLGYFKCPTIIDNEVSTALQQALHLLDDEKHNKLQSHTCLTQALSKLFHRHTVRQSSTREHLKDHRIVRQALDFIRSRVTENITLKEVAASVGFSQYHFLRVFKHTTGMPPHAYQIQMRVALAKAAIEKGFSLADAALESGFSDQSHMTRSFKAVYGLPPGQYKNSIFL